MLVCRSWYNINIPGIYEHVYIHRIGQLLSLVRTLEQRLAQESLCNSGHQIEGLNIGKSESINSYKSQRHDEEQVEVSELGRRVNRFTIDCFVPEAWYDVFCDGLARLLKLCPFIQVLVYGPSLDWTSIASRCNTTFMDCFTSRDARVLPQDKHYFHRLRHLLLQSPFASIPSLLGCTLPSVFLQLTSLEIGDLSLDDEADANDVSSVIHHAELQFPNLRTLALLTTSSNGTSARIDIIAQSWKLPQLRQLFLNSKAVADFRIVPRLLTAERLQKLLGAHGSQLECLFIDIDSCVRLDMKVFVAVLESCPRLRSLAVPFHDVQSLGEDSSFLCRALPPSPLSLLILYHLRFSVNFMLGCSCLFEALTSQGQFSALKIIRILHPGIDDLTYPILPMSTSLASSRSENAPPEIYLENCIKMLHLTRYNANTLSHWIERLSHIGVVVENYQQRRVVALPSYQYSERASDLNEMKHVSDDYNSDDSDHTDASYEFSEGETTTSFEDSDVDSAGDSIYRRAQNPPREGERAISLTVADIVRFDGDDQVSWNEALDIFDEIVEQGYDGETSDSETVSIDLSVFAGF